MAVYVILCSAERQPALPASCPQIYVGRGGAPGYDRREIGRASGELSAAERHEARRAGLEFFLSAGWSPDTLAWLIEGRAPSAPTRRTAEAQIEQGQAQAVSVTPRALYLAKGNLLELDIEAGGADAFAGDLGATCARLSTFQATPFAVAPELPATTAWFSPSGGEFAKASGARASRVRAPDSLGWFASLGAPVRVIKENRPQDNGPPPDRHPRKTQGEPA